MLLLDVKREGGRSEKVERCFIYSLERPMFLCEVGNCSDITGHQSPAKPQNLAEILRNYRVGLPCPRGHCVKRPVCQQDGPWGTLICSFRLWESLSGMWLQSHSIRRLSLARLLLNQGPACTCACSIESDSTTPWTVAHQAPLSTGFSRQEYWSG